MKSEKSRKRQAAKHHNPYGHKQYGAFAKAYRQMRYRATKWGRK